jgi:transcriptional regulator with XRE-family HTH domain
VIVTTMMRPSSPPSVVPARAGATSTTIPTTWHRTLDGVPNSSRRRPELAAFLRTRRARIAPVEVGLVPGPSRRTPGLRREEVAVLSGVGTTWYTWLEQGRPINVSAEILDAVARTLRLDPTEQAYLHQLAGLRHAPVPAPAHRIGPELQQVLDALAPLPACVLDARFDVRAWNAPYAVLWRRTLADPRRNVLWQCFTLPPCCSPFAVDREAELRQLVSVLRAEWAGHADDPAWEGFIAELGAASPEFAAMWAGHDVAVPVTRVKHFRHAAVGVVSMSVTAFALTDAPGLRMTVYTPVDAAAHDRLERLLADPAAPPADHEHELRR